MSTRVCPYDPNTPEAEQWFREFYAKYETTPPGAIDPQFIREGSKPGKITKERQAELKRQSEERQNWGIKSKYVLRR